MGTLSYGSLLIPQLDEGVRSPVDWSFLGIPWATGGYTPQGHIRTTGLPRLDSSSLRPLANLMFSFKNPLFVFLLVPAEEPLKLLILKLP